MVIEPTNWDHPLPPPALGDSIAVSGVCLTVADLSRQGCWGFDVIPETLSRTTLGRLTIGARVNLEHAVTAATLMGGHFVQGHIDATGEVIAVQAKADWRVAIRVPAAVAPYLTPKGSVCVDGVSLTIAEVNHAARTFSIALIPQTLERTTLRELQPGHAVNIEGDMLIKAIVQTLRTLPAQTLAGLINPAAGEPADAGADGPRAGKA